MFKDKELTRKVAKLEIDRDSTIYETTELEYRVKRLERALVEQGAKFKKDMGPLCLQVAKQQADINTLAEVVTMLLKYLSIKIETGTKLVPDLGIK